MEVRKGFAAAGKYHRKSGKDYSTLAELQVQDPANLSHHEHKWQLGPERQS